MNIKNLIKHIVKRTKNRFGYTNCLLNNREKLRRKILEEAYELVSEIGKEKKRFIREWSDLLYHMIVSLIGMGVELRDILKELRSRRGKRIERKKIQ
ncbi:phosphoribosyl-ATP diphosphatase [Candidatus Vidania fulgoroideorum]